MGWRDRVAEVAAVITYQPVFGDSAMRHREHLNRHRRGLRLSVRGLNRIYHALTPAARTHPLLPQLLTAAAGLAGDIITARRQRAQPYWDGFLQRFAASGAETVLASRWAAGERFSAGISHYLFPDEFEAAVTRGPGTALAGTTAVAGALAADHHRRRRPLLARSFRYTAAGYAAATAYRYLLNSGVRRDDAVMVEQLHNRRVDATVSTAHHLTETAEGTAALADLKPDDLERLPGSLAGLDRLWKLRAAHRRFLHDNDMPPVPPPTILGRSNPRTRNELWGTTVQLLVHHAVDKRQIRPGRTVSNETRVDKVNVLPRTQVDLHALQAERVKRWLDANFAERLTVIGDRPPHRLELEVRIVDTPNYLGDRMVIEMGPKGDRAIQYTVPSVSDRAPGSQLDPMLAAYVIGIAWGLFQFGVEPVGACVLTGSSLAALSLELVRGQPKHRHILWTVASQAAAMIAWRLADRPAINKNDGLAHVFPMNAAYLPLIFVSALWPQDATGPGQNSPTRTDVHQDQLRRACQLGAVAVVGVAVAGVCSARRRKGLGWMDVVAELVYLLEIPFAATRLYRPLSELASGNRGDHDRRLDLVAELRSHHIHATVLRPALGFIGPALRFADDTLAALEADPDADQATVIDFVKARSVLEEADANRAELEQGAARLEKLLVEHFDAVNSAEQQTGAQRTPHIVIDAPALGAPKADGSDTTLFDAWRQLRGDYRPATLELPLPLPFEVNLRAAAVIAARHGRPLVVDIDRTIVHLDTPDDPGIVTAALVRAVEVVAEARHGFRTTETGERPAIPLLAFASNADRLHDHAVIDRAGEEQGMPVIVAMRANKHRPHRGPLAPHLDSLAGAVVYGDQILTDGQLARTLTGIWVQPPWGLDRSDIKLRGNPRAWSGRLNTALNMVIGDVRLSRSFYRII